MRIKVKKFSGFTGIIDIFDDQITLQPAGDIPRIPEDTHDRVIFTRNQGEYKFDYSFYSPVLTNEIIKEKDLENFFAQLHTIIKSHKFIGKKFIFRYYLLLMLLAIGIIFGSIVPALKRFFVYTLLCVLIPALIFVIGYMWEIRKLIKTQNLIYEKAKKLGEAENLKYSKNGVRWIITKHFPIFLELKLDFRTSSLPKRIVIDDNPLEVDEENIVLNFDLNAENITDKTLVSYKNKSE
jgi:hypothetical protein